MSGYVGQLRQWTPTSKYPKCWDYSFGPCRMEGDRWDGRCWKHTQKLDRPDPTLPLDGRCNATKRDGNPCHGLASGSDGLCWRHSSDPECRASQAAVNRHKWTHAGRRTALGPLPLAASDVMDMTVAQWLVLSSVARQLAHIADNA